MTANSFVWYELATTDIESALKFYAAVLGWEAADFPGSDERYAIVSAKGKGVGAVMATRGDMPPAWTGYVGTDDIEKSVEGITRGGGSVLHGPFDLPNIGQVAVVADPAGAILVLFRGQSDHRSEAFDQALPGHGNWHELRTTDPEAALGFYSAQFGWTKGDGVDMGPMGVYQIFKSGEAQIGGIMKGMGPGKPHWIFYFGVENIHAAATRITDAGGSILHGPSPVPGGAMIVQAHDPQGAVFAVVGPG